MLGVVLALGYPFSNQTVSLIGFSLGCQVIKSCLKTLHKLGANDIIQNVSLLGGATHFTTDIPLWERIFSLTVAGKVKNSYSKKDSVLALYFICQKHEAVGRHLIMSDSKNNLKGSADKEDDVVVTERDIFKLKNYMNIHGHMDYKRKLAEIVSGLKIEE